MLFEALVGAIANLATVEHLLHLALGVMLGLAVGAFPGLGGIAGVAIMLPFLYGMDTVSALATLVGLVAVIPASDTFTSVLMGIPGSSASQAEFNSFAASATCRVSNGVSRSLHGPRRIPRSRCWREWE